jgi:ketosteroid isomerase-like protein
MTERIDAKRVREAFDAFGRGDFESVIELFDAATKWEENQAGGFPGLDPLYVGPAGIRKWMHDTREAWQSIESLVEDLEEVQTIDGPSFVVTTQLRARGRQDIEVDMSLYNVFWTSGDHLLRRRIYFDRDEAIAAAAQPSRDLDR